MEPGAAAFWSSDPEIRSKEGSRSRPFPHSSEREEWDELGLIGELSPAESSSALADFGSSPAFS